MHIVLSLVSLIVFSDLRRTKLFGFSSLRIASKRLRFDTETVVVKSSVS